MPGRRTAATGTPSPCPLQPRGVATVDALAAAGQELRILHMEHADVLAIDVDVVEIAQLLQHEVAGIEQDLAAFVAADQFMEALEAGAVVQVLAGVDFVAQVHALLVAGVQDGAPAARQLLEGGLDEAGRALREREQVSNQFRAGKRGSGRLAGRAPPPARAVHHRPPATRDGRGRVAGRRGCAGPGRLLCRLHGISVQARDGVSRPRLLAASGTAMGVLDQALRPARRS